MCGLIATNVAAAAKYQREKMAKLEKYKEKRNFEKTGEPAGDLPGGERETARVGQNADEKSGGLRYVVQHHIARRDHYDFRLEWEGALLSWAVPKGPSFDPRDKRLAVRVEDHPLDYRNFEGTIPKGQYGGGTVMLWDEGYWEPMGDAGKGLSGGSLKFELFGERLKGKWALVRMKTGDEGENWLLLKEKDGYAKTGGGISGFSASVRTGRTMDEIAGEADFTKNPFDSAEAQLARLASEVPQGEDWLYELKYDGYRILAFAEGGVVRLLTRKGNGLTHRFGGVAESVTKLAGGRAMVLDGEMVITDERGRTDFQAMQNYLRNGGRGLTYIIFDILALDGEDLRGRPLTDRKKILTKVMKNAPENLYLSKFVKGRGKESLDAACKLDLEGVIGKRADSAYSGTRNGDWIKLKCGRRQEFVVGGYTLSGKKKSGVSSLLLGYYDGGELVYAGRSGTGFTERDRDELAEKFRSITRKTSPFKDAPEERRDEKITWLEPVTVAEINFAEWTEENLLRQASFKGLRIDKEPKDVKMERATIEKEEKTTPRFDGTVKTRGGETAVAGIKITNPGKVIFDEPKTTKIDLVSYYAQIADKMMPYLGGRVLSLVRCPRGIFEPCFFKKHPGGDGKGVAVIPITNSEGEKEDYLYINNAWGLVSEAQMGTVEFHVWGSRAENLEKPDMMVFDLDPDEGMDLAGVRRGVRDIKGVLDSLSLVSFLKTSGGKGYHVVVPFEPHADWEAFRAFAKRVAEVMESEWPDRYTSNMRKEKRKGRIFIDWVRNGRGATSIAPYSVRARKGARVSMPLAWEELDAVAPGGITMAAALAKKGDPWKDFYKIKQRLNMKL